MSWLEIDLWWMVDFINATATVPTRASTQLNGEIIAPDTTPASLHGLSEEERTTLGDRWFRVFESAASSDPELIASTIEELLALARPTLHATTDAQRVRHRMTPDHASSNLARATVAGTITLLDELDRPGPPRLGLCSEDVCRDVYIDRSPRANRSYCSTTCQTRMRVRRHRRHSTTN